MSCIVSLVPANDRSAASLQQCFCTVMVERSPSIPNRASAAYEPSLLQVHFQ
jgi:hypothetical protein